MLAYFVAFIAVYYVYWFFVVKQEQTLLNDLRRGFDMENFPPGPRFPVPLFGDALWVGNRIKGAEMLAKKFGDISGFWTVGGLRMVIVNGFELLQEVNAKEEFSSRPNSSAMKEAMGEVRGTVPGVLFSNGANWHDQRRFTLHTLKNLGFGKNSMESVVSEEAVDLCRFLQSKNGEPMDIRNEFNMSVLNVLWRLVTSERLQRDDQKLRDLMLLLDQTFQEGQSIIMRLVVNIKPLRMINNIFKFFKTTTAFKAMVDFGKENIASHESTYQEDNMRDFIDYYLREINTKTAEPGESNFKGKDGMANLSVIMSDLFIAGSETTSTTLNWGMLYMILNPDVQKKVQEELDAVTGRSRLPSISDKGSTPYTEAVIHEIQRMGNILAHAVIHFSPEGGHLQDGKYYLPPKTLIICNLGHVMSDPKHFPKPEKFRPERYLEDGKFVPNPRVIPFGLGKRRCLGESLAKMELYVFFTTLLSNFTVAKAEDNDCPSTEPIMGTTLSPKPFKLRFLPRQ